MRKADLNPTVHGHSTYHNHGCRCDVCRSAASAYKQARREKARAARRTAEAEGGRYVAEGVTHGENGYDNYMCRCDVCRTAHNTASNRRARRRRAEVADATG